MKKPAPSELQEKYPFRFTEDGVKDRLAELAKKNERSMNTEIMVAIKNHLEANAVSNSDLHRRMMAIESMLKRIMEFFKINGKSHDENHNSR